jgi:hypothetical protein
VDGMQFPYYKGHTTIDCSTIIISWIYPEDLVRKNYILQINAEEFVEVRSRMYNTQPQNKHKRITTYMHNLNEIIGDNRCQ